jgi:hypothetical protein
MRPRMRVRASVYVFVERGQVDVHMYARGPVGPCMTIDTIDTSACTFTGCPLISSWERPAKMDLWGGLDG